MQRAIGYIRVSTSGQAEQGISLENQEERIKTYCQLNDLELVEIVRDEGISAKSLKKRPKAITMLSRAKQEGYSVIVYKLDRMFRNTVESLQTIDSLAKAGSQFHSIQERLDTSSAFGKFVLTQIAALAELERNIISERTKDALSLKKAQGLRTGNIPFGYQLGEDGQSLEKCEKEMEILKFVYCRIALGVSHRKVTNALNSAGYKTRTGKPFTKPTVSNLCRISLRHFS